MPVKKIAAEPQGQSGGSPGSATGSESPYVGTSLGLPAAWLQGTGASSAGTAPVATLAEQMPTAPGDVPDAASKGSQELVSSATGERKRQPQGTVGAEAAGGGRGVAKAMPTDPRGRIAASAPGVQERGTGRSPAAGKVVPAGLQGRLATPPAFPGTLGVDPRLPEGSGSRAFLQAQEGHVRPSEVLPSVPAGTLKAGMADASGAEGPRDDQGVGPFGGGGAQYTASLGLSTPEPMRIDDRGRADLSGHRGKSNGIAHEWAQAYADKQYAWSKFVDAETPEEAAHWAEQAEDAENRLNRADEQIDRSGDADTIRKQAWEDKERIAKREARAREREEAAAERAQQRRERKGRAWRSNRRHQDTERAKRNARRRERRLGEGHVGRHGSRRDGLSDEALARWGELQHGKKKDGRLIAKGIDQLRDELEEIENRLDDPRTSPDQRRKDEADKKRIENEIEQKEIEQEWLEEGGFPCAELDCCDDKYAKCRPDCPPGWKCVCRKPANCGDPPKDKKREGGGNNEEEDEKEADPKKATTPGGSGKHAPKEVQPPDAGPPPTPDGDGGGPNEGGPPGVKYPDDVGGDGGDEGGDAKSPDDGRPGKQPWRPLGDAPPREFTDGNKEYPVNEKEGLVQGDNGLWYELEDKEGNRVTEAQLPPPEIRDGKKVYKLAGFRRRWLPRLPGEPGQTIAEKAKAYWEAAKSIAADVTGFLAQVMGAFAGLGFEFGMRLGALITGKSKPTMDDLMGPINELIATTDFANLSEAEAWAVNMLASALDGFTAPMDSFKAFGKGLIESPKAFVQMLKDAANGDPKAQLSLLLFAATLRPGQSVAAAKRLMGKVKSVSASAARDLEALAASGKNAIGDVVAALEGKGRAKTGRMEYVGEKVRVSLDERGRVTKIEMVDGSGAVREVAPSGAAGGGGQRRAAPTGGAEQPTVRKRSAAEDQAPEAVAVGAGHEAAGASRGSGAGGGGSGGAGERKTAAKPTTEPTKKPPATAGGGGDGGGKKPPKRPTASGEGERRPDDGDRRGGGGGGDESPPPPPPHVRLAEFYRRLKRAPRATSAKGAMQQVEDILNGVEDEMSGVVRKDPPPPPNMPDGRMYAPLPDNTNTLADGTLVGETRRHRVEAFPDGGIRITRRATGEVEFEKPGGG